MNPGVHAAIMAAQAAEKRKREQEEERMTRYSPEELEQEWEFKIVRSNFPVFRKPEVFQQVVEEEALAGWQMLEKLDDNRIRFKRPASSRRKDDMLPLDIDPYRTQVGGTGRAGLVIALLAGGLALGIGLLAFMMVSENGAPNLDVPWVGITAGIILVIFVVGIITAARARIR